MSFVGAEILQEVVGLQASGPAGFGVHYQVANGADINPDTRTVDVKLNEQSLAAARAQNESGVNKEVAQTLAPESRAPEPKPSRALSFIAKQQDKADTLYGAMFEKRGLSAAVQRGMSPSSGARRYDHRTALAKGGEVAKNPLLRIKQRHLLRLRKTFDDIAARKTKSVALNPENMPRPVMEKMVDQAISTGMKMTPLGPIAKAVKVAGFNPKEWARWEHALIGGFSAPRPRAY